MSGWAAGTIAARARLPSARVVDTSLAELIGPDALDLPDLRTRAFRHEREPLSCALTPTVLRHLLTRGLRRALRRSVRRRRGVVRRLAARAGRRALAAVSRLWLALHERREDLAERERMLVRAGTHNAGAVGVSDRPEARRAARRRTSRRDRPASLGPHAAPALA